jgi:hypothetical protein
MSRNSSRRSIRVVPSRVRHGLLAVVAVGVTSVSAVPAQEATASRTHVVRAGDTLWDLSRAYLNDPFLWPEIYRLNTSVVEDPHWIYPGEVLRLPDGAGTTTTTVADRVERDEAPRMQTRTVFSQMIEAPAEAFGGVTTAPKVPQPSIRRGELVAAPWVDLKGGPEGQGRIVASAEMSGIAEMVVRHRLEPQDRAYIRLPQTSVAAVGDRFLSFRLGPMLDDERQVIVPTGVLQVERADNGDATTVRTIMEFDEVNIGDGVIALPTLTLPDDVRPAPLEGGLQTQVVWIASEAVLPTLQHYVVLDAAEQAGVKLGDHFTVMRPRVTLEDGSVLPPESVALLQIVRVTARGSTAIVLDQRHPAIKMGALAQLTAKMP